MNNQTAVAIPTELQDELQQWTARFDDAVLKSLDGEALNAALQLSEKIERFALASHFGANFVCREPGDFIALVTQADEPRDGDHYTQLIAEALAAVSDIPHAKAALRRLRQREMVRIAWRDIVLGADVFSVMTELSAFADACIEGAVRWLQQHFTARFGIASDQHGDELALMVIGMGKLGGNELNFSSDIDLIFVYGEDGETHGGRREVTHQEYFDRIGREFIGLLNETTVDGYVFRVDMRLRPFGDSGPLTTSVAGLEHYYAVHGRDWERYALIKGRVITGDERSRKRLQDIIKPFVFRRYLDFGALEALREMKQLINREAGSAEMAGDVKRGPGGIREIEFTAQLFQLTRGGREPRLRERGLENTLQTIAGLDLLPATTVADLLAAYRFLRVSEHRLQQLNDWQTHALPDDTMARARQAYAMGFDDWLSYSETLKQHRDTTRAHFAALLGDGENCDEDELKPWIKLWRAAVDASELDAALAALPLAALKDTYTPLLELQSERFQQRLSRQGRERLDRLMPLLLAACTAEQTSAAGFERLVKLIAAVARRSVYVAFLADNPGALERLVKLFNASPWIADQIIAQPLLLDELLDPQSLFAPPDAARLTQLAEQHIRHDDGLESAMEALRAFRNQQMLRVAASEATDQFPLTEVSNQLTDIAEVCVRNALTLAWAETTAKYGCPGYEQDGEWLQAGFGIIGYGKLGGYELGYGSDLDVVFLHDCEGGKGHTRGNREIENEVFYTRLAQRFIHILSTTTPTGSAYEIDTRLRPSGSAGMMVTSTASFTRYLGEEAWVWEHQALVRARAVAGDESIASAFAETRAAVLARARNDRELQTEITSMRQRMRGELDRSNEQQFDLKQGRGGITDIEFMVQYAVLRWAAEHPVLLNWTDNLRLLETIASLALWSPQTCQALRDAYFAYRAANHRCALQHIDGIVAASEFAAHREQVSTNWDKLFGG